MLRQLPILCLFPALVSAAEVTPAVPAASQAPAVAPAPAAVPPRIDPTAAVVAEGRFIYRQRDLDALMQIAQRHAKGRLGKNDEERLRQVLLHAMIAREGLVEALAALPLSGKAREDFALDLLDYQAEPSTRSAAPAAAPATGEKAGSDKPAAPVAAPAPTADAGPVLVRLPPLTLVRTLDGLGKRQLTLGIALNLQTPTLAKSLEAKAPLIQDAILTFVQRLPAAQFAEPDQVALKDGLTKAVIGKVPEFPVDGILIPQLDAGLPDAAPGK
jgi:flagellar basal body-associated protein FliL